MLSLSYRRLSCLSACLSVCLSVCDGCVLWPNGWMDPDATWYGGRHRPKPHFVRWGLSSPCPPNKEGSEQSPIFSPCLLWPYCRPSQQLVSSCLQGFFVQVYRLVSLSAMLYRYFLMSVYYVCGCWSGVIGKASPLQMSGWLEHFIFICDTSSS